MKLLITDQAVIHIMEKLASTTRRSPSVLAKYRRDGVGPRFRRIQGRVFYCDMDIGLWIGSARYVANLRRHQQ